MADPCPKITCMELDWAWKFHQDLLIPLKVTFFEDIQTDTRPPIHIQTGEIFLIPFWIPFTSVCLLCLLHSWKIISKLWILCVSVAKQQELFFGCFLKRRACRSRSFQRWVHRSLGTCWLRWVFDKWLDCSLANSSCKLMMALILRWWKRLILFPKGHTF